MTRPAYHPHVPASGPASATPPQEVRFCRSVDGVRIAYAVHGSGPPLVISTCWLSHLQFDWESPVWRHFLEDLGRFATVIRFDERGYGLSDWDVTDFSLDMRIADLEAVVEDAGYPQFALMAMAQGGPVAIRYAAEHPERVTRLLFYNSYADAARDLTPEQVEVEDTFDQMIKVGWARPDSTFRRVFTSLLVPAATEQQKGWLDELQRVAASATSAYESRRQRRHHGAMECLAQLDVPTLVIHATGERINGFEEGRFLATSIRGARLVPLDSQNHIVLEDEPAWPVFVHEVEEFLRPDREAAGVRPTSSTPLGLSAREREVLTLAAQGLDNDDIARELHLSVRTVERHLQNVYVKLDVQGKSARAAAVARLLTNA
jgi:pimeloyl-ACP methyl ester carboxylesterase/DNA-binding CsgD family transcriptional regulator